MENDVEGEVDVDQMVDDNVRGLLKDFRLKGNIDRDTETIPDRDH